MKIIFFTAIFLITGCATVPTNPNFSINQGESIAILVDIPENLIHTHVGTTIFNNFTKNHPYKWKLDSYTTSHLTKNLQSQGFKVINISEMGISPDDIQELIIVNKKQWTVNSKHTKLYENLKNKGIKGVVYVQSQKTVAFTQCNMYNCNYHYIDSYGLFTRSFLGIKFYHAVAAFNAGFIVLDPLVKNEYIEEKSIRLKNFTKPLDFKNVSESEWLPIKSEIVKYLDTLALKIPKLLKNN